MVNVVIKTILLYIILFFAVRLMGQKQTGHLQPYELIITLMIAEVATTPMNEPGTPLLYGVVPAVTLFLMYSLISLLCVKFRKFSLFVSGKPSILIHNGSICYDEIKKVGYDLNDLVEQLRIAGNTDITTIHYAVLETNGQLSVLPYARYLPLTPKDMSIGAEKSTLHSSLVVDGKLNVSSISQLNLEESRVKSLIASLGYASPRHILLLTVNDTGDAFLQDKSGATRSLSLGREWLHV